ncbi:MAG: hypothetical protein HOY79_49410 [Streptomyces sp.]|nr:hypothetical protein [Streptomyces sp.]
MRIDRDSDGNPSISMYATDAQTRAFVQAVTDTELAWWARQQELGSVHANLAEDRSSHDHSAAIAHDEIRRRTRHA